MPSINDLRDVFQDLADDAPIVGDAVTERAELIEIVPIGPHERFPSRRRGILVTGLAVAAMLLAALIILPGALRTGHHTLGGNAPAGVCAGQVTFCSNVGTPWSATLHLNGRPAPFLGVERNGPPRAVHVAAGSHLTFTLTIRHKPGVTVRNAYLFAFPGAYVFHGARPIGRVSIVGHHAAVLTSGQAMTGTWTAAPIAGNRQLYVGLSLHIGKSNNEEVNLTKLLITPSAR